MLYGVAITMEAREYELSPFITLAAGVFVRQRSAGNPYVERCRMYAYISSSTSAGKLVFWQRWLGEWLARR
jgi:hypothetical protein